MKASLCKSELLHFKETSTMVYSGYKTICASVGSNFAGPVRIPSFVILLFHGE